MKATRSGFGWLSCGQIKNEAGRFGLGLIKGGGFWVNDMDGDGNGDAVVGYGAAEYP